MQKLFQLKNLVTIVLFFYFTNLYASDNDANIFYGGADTCETVEVNYNDIRIVNSKLIELEYEKEINNKLKLIIASDSAIIDTLENRVCRFSSNNYELAKQNTKLRKQRNIGFGVAFISIILAVVAIAH